MIAMTTRRLCDLTEGVEREGLDKDLYFNLMFLDFFFSFSLLFFFFSLLYLNVFIRQVCCLIHQDGNLMFVVHFCRIHSNSNIK